MTGGAGFIGSSLVDALLDAGHQADVVDNLTTGSLDNLDAALRHGDDFRFAEIDVRSPAFGTYVAARAPDVIVHLAAQASVAASVQDPVTDAEINLIGTLRVLEAARRAAAVKVLFAASAAIYGEVAEEDLPINESHRHSPRSPYGISKMAAISYLESYGRLYGVKWTALALANVYGPRQSETGEAGVVARFAAKLRNGIAPTIDGDGSQSRDFVFIDDVCDAFIRAMTAGNNELINIGTGVGISINQLLSEMNSLSNQPLEPIFGPSREGDVHASRLDPSLARATLGWQPTTSITDGLRKLLAI